MQVLAPAAPRFLCPGRRHIERRARSGFSPAAALPSPLNPAPSWRPAATSVRARPPEMTSPSVGAPPLPPRAPPRPRLSASSPSPSPVARFLSASLPLPPLASSPAPEYTHLPGPILSPSSPLPPPSFPVGPEGSGPAAGASRLRHRRPLGKMDTAEEGKSPALQRPRPCTGAGVRSRVARGPRSSRRAAGCLGSLLGRLAQGATGSSGGERKVTPCAPPAVSRHCRRGAGTPARPGGWGCR